MPFCTEGRSQLPVRRQISWRLGPVYETLPGWKCDIRGVTDYGKLPQAARDYVDFIEKHIEAPITIVSTGPKRHEICRRAGS